ncbi:extracellular solute-binding protein [Paenibacillus sp. YN15]|uniref:extracellular solute-binding protein n=1 Tax=Paenibacillus sp. YN15 TaxID=1742774 RepID=UPI0015EC7635|nr:extracellular solute-binding protein [Paenibacillus sp. YN15]
MTKKWGQYVIALSVAGLAAAGLAGCSAKEPSPAGGASAAPDSSASAAVKGKFRIFVSDFNNQYPAVPSMQIPAIKYMGEKTNNDIDLVFIPHGQYADQLRIKFASGDIPDVYQTWGIADAEPIQNNLAMELNELLDKYGPNLKKNIPKSAWDAVTINGRIMGIPTPAGFNAPAERILYVRKDWMNKLGLQAPKTSDELLAVLKAFKEKDPNGNGKPDEIPLTSREKFTWLENIFGMWGVNPDSFSVYNDQVIPSFIHPNILKGLEFIRTLYAEKLIDSEFMTNNSTVWKQKILSDRVGMFNHNQSTGGSWYRDMRSSLKDNPDADFMAIPTPQGAGYTGPVGRVEQPVGKTFILFKQSKNAEAVIRFFDWLATEEGNAYAAYGAEGQALTRQGNDLIHTPDKEKEFQEAWRNAIFNIVVLDSTLRKVKQDEAIFDHTMQAVEVARKEGIPNPFAPMPIPQSLMSQSELKWSGSLFQEAVAKIIVGDKPLESFDEFVAMWKKQGGDKIIKEATDWYNQNVKK